MRIGNVEVQGIARLAPMAAISNAPFRLIAQECGSGMTTTEEIDATSLIFNSLNAQDISRYYPEERPLAMQLLGCDVDLLCAAAAILQEMGADVIDLNMGCPVPKITKQGKGSALMRDPLTTAPIIRAMRKAIHVPFTVKIRGGWDNATLNAVEVAHMLEDEGVDAITVHPRTRSQQFTGRAPWQIIADVVEAVHIPVTGNGDVKSMADAREMLTTTGCANVMVGRGAVGSPWVFDERYDEMPRPEQLRYRERVIRRHIALIRQHYEGNESTGRKELRQREHDGRTQIRKHLAWYSEGFPHSAETRLKVFQSETIDEALDAFWSFWEKNVRPEYEAVTA
jgi:tRNA-dihydrouridine synthase B